MPSGWHRGPASVSVILSSLSLLSLSLCPSPILPISLHVSSSISPYFGPFLSLSVSTLAFPSLPASVFPLPWVSPFSGCPQPCSACPGTPSPTLCSARSQQRPSPMAAAPLAQGPALTVTHRADGGDFDEEAIPHCGGPNVCVFAPMHEHPCQAVSSPLPSLPNSDQEGTGSRGPLPATPPRPIPLLPFCDLISIHSACPAASPCQGSCSHVVGSGWH